jgi:hypothetical protein
MYFGGGLVDGQHAACDARLHPVAERFAQTRIVIRECPARLRILSGLCAVGDRGGSPRRSRMRLEKRLPGY